MARESAEEKIARIVRDTFAAENRKATEEKDPNKAWLRQAIREEVGSVLGDLLSDKGDAGGRRSARRRPGDGEDDEEGGGVFSLFGS